MLNLFVKKNSFSFNSITFLSKLVLNYFNINITFGYYRLNKVSYIGL